MLIYICPEHEKTDYDMEIINIEAHTFEAMMTRFENFAERVEALCRANGEKTLQKWLDNQDMCEILNISPRTLQTMRDNGTIPYTRIGNKMYYKSDDLKRLIPLVTDHKRK
jgi:excisionase family DNA binding protein